MLMGASRGAHGSVAAVAGREVFTSKLAGFTPALCCLPRPGGGAVFHCAELRRTPRDARLAAADPQCGGGTPTARWRPPPHALPRAAAPAGGVGADLFGDALMLQLTPQSRIFVATEPVDFRKGVDGLAAVCRRALGANPLNGALYVFRNRPGTTLKILCYDGQGYWLSRTVHNASRCDLDGGDASRFTSLLWRCKTR